MVSDTVLGAEQGIGAGACRSSIVGVLRSPRTHPISLIAPICRNLEQYGGRVRESDDNNGRDHECFPRDPPAVTVRTPAIAPGATYPLLIEPAPKLVDPRFAPHSLNSLRYCVGKMSQGPPTLDTRVVQRARPARACRKPLGRGFPPYCATLCDG